MLESFDQRCEHVKGVGLLEQARTLAVESLPWSWAVVRARGRYATTWA